MFIFARCLRSSAPAKYELDIIQVTTVFIIRKKWENTERSGEIWLSNPHPNNIGMLAFDQHVHLSKWFEDIIHLNTARHPLPRRNTTAFTRQHANHWDPFKILWVYE